MILVLNAGGNVGSELVKALDQRGADFTAAFRSVEKVRAAEETGVRAAVADMTAPETLRAAMKGADQVFMVGPPSPNLESLEANVVDAAQAAGVAHIVKLSVWGAEEGKFIFSKPHQAIERRIVESGLRYTFLRPTGFMQNMLGNAATIKSQGAFYMPAGDARVAEIDVRDIASVAATALTEEGHAGMAYDLTGEESMTYGERAQILSEVLGRPVAYVSPPAADWKATLLSYGVSEWQADGILDLLAYYRDGSSQRVSPSVEDVTGQKPITYRRFIEDYADAFR